MPRSTSPQTTLPAIEQQHQSVRQIGFRLQGDCPTINKTVFIAYRRAVEEQFLAAINHLIACQGGNTRRQEKGLASVRKHVTEETTLTRELLHGNAAFPIRMVSAEIFCPEHPLMSAFGVGGKRSPERIACVVTCRLGIKTVCHACREADTFHSGQTALGVRLPCKEGKRHDKEEKCKLSHHYFTSSSLISLARTRFSFSMTND